MNKTLKPATKIMVMMLGFILIALGIALFFMSNIGSNPMTTLVEGLTSKLPWSFGTVNMLASFILLVLSYWSSKRFLGIGTILNMVVIGYLVDAWTWLFQGHVVVSPLWIQLLLSVVGTLILAFGVALYMYVDMGFGPYEMFMEMVSELTGWSLATSRTIQEVSVLLVGILMGGRFGLGTIINALFTGYLLAFFYKKVKTWFEGEH